MSLQAALSAALTSLAAEQRASSVIANNVANVQTPGFVRRDLPRSENLVGGTGSGVATGVVQRAADTVLATASRAANGAEAFAGRLQSLLASYTSVIGQPADERSLSSRLGAFQEAMTALSAAPNDAVVQGEALAAAQDLVDSFHDMDAAISRSRTEADFGVARDVDAVNTALRDLQEVERQRALAAARGASTAENEDKRDTLLADIAVRLPIRVHDNGPGRLLVMTDGGNTLFDSGNPRALAFSHTPQIASDIRRHGSAPYTDGLSDITVGGMVLRVSDSGSIAAGLKLRDEVMPRFADMLDQVAGRLAESFQEADPSLGAGQAGLFTRDGAAGFDPAAPAVGMARLIGINALVDPDQVADPSTAPPSLGQLWRMRDGMGAVVEGSTSDNRIILGWLDALGRNRDYDSGTGLPGSMGLPQAASQVVGLMQSERGTWTDRAITRASIALQARQDLTNKTAVSVDEELQRLLMVQQTYSASVQVIQAAAKMLDELGSLRR
ncbi:flagellar hook-associated protein FlgK [Roseomonas marmotae]|uniref:Flagellar hook-associated protein 1 n=1 Tax=Roseomonas marmotae TaxID=2768161 RepID=A0ABS3KF00_9PROT|nr:flagellar hook-associated protein FlgK [Roseomonas marmotae]MBO1076048.1 flagellar hook-associated protein FlgK [Roseomonas marmotae]